MASVRLTVLGVEKLRPDPAKRLEIGDAKLTGLYLVVQPSGAKSWAVRGRLSNQPIKVTLGAYPVLSLEEARRRAGEALDQLALGRDPRQIRAEARTAEERRRNETVGAILDEFEKRHAGKLKSGREAMRLLRRELADWHDRSIHGIGRKDVLKVLDAAVDRGAETMANRCLAHVRKLMNWCIERGIIPATANPCAGLKPPTKERSRDRTLAEDEVAAVWRAAGRLGYPFGPAIRLLIATGQRREEVGQLTWSELDFDKGLWAMPADRNKGGRQHAVPLNALALEALAACPRAGEFVFTTTGRAAVSGWSKAKLLLDRAIAEERGATLAPWVIHDLRRTMASGLVALGVRPDVVEAVLGHAHPGGSQLASVYQRHGYLPEMRDALDRWSRHLAGLLDPAAGQRGRAGEADQPSGILAQPHPAPGSAAVATTLASRACRDRSGCCPPCRGALRSSCQRRRDHEP